MRYEITHVLEGIVLLRTAKLKSLGEELVAKNQELQQLKVRLQAGPTQLADLLRERANVADLTLQAGREEFQLVRDTLTKLERSLPSTYEVGNLERKLDQLAEELTLLAAVAEKADTRLEQFLRALQAGGETHVSQHSLKQAGFAAEYLVGAILAAAQARKEPDA